MLTILNHSPPPNARATICDMKYKSVYTFTHKYNKADTVIGTVAECLHGRAHKMLFLSDVASLPTHKRLPNCTVQLRLTCKSSEANFAS
jgi:hypothetical protein